MNTPFLHNAVWVLIDAGLKTALLLAIAGLVCLALRRASAAVRHRLWSLSLTGALLVPIVSSVVPQWRIPLFAETPPAAVAAVPAVEIVAPDPSPEVAAVPPAQFEGDEFAAPSAGGRWTGRPRFGFSPGGMAFDPPGPIAVAPESPPVDAAPVEEVAALPAEQPAALSLLTVVLASIAHYAPHVALLWLAGASAVLAPFALGALATRRLVRRARAVSSPWQGGARGGRSELQSTSHSRLTTHPSLPVPGLRRTARRKVIERDARTNDLVVGLAQRLGMRRHVTLVEADQPIVPMTLGIVRPLIVLPPNWRTWPAERLRFVLLHELAHIRRLDVLHQTIGRIACGLYWFNPLAWLALYRLRIERELACDDCVLGVGEAASAYAGQLLEIARTYRPARLAGGIAMARSSKLEGRIVSLLDCARSHAAVSRAVAGALLVAATTLVLTLSFVKFGEADSTATDEQTEVAETATDATEASADTDEATASTTDAETPAATVALAVADTSAPGASAETAEPGSIENPKSEIQNPLFTFAGTVVDPDGKPVSGAKVALNVIRKSHGEPVGALTDARGRFEFTSTRADLAERGEPFNWTESSLVATKDGYGFACGPAVHFETNGRFDAELTDAVRQQLELRSPAKTDVLALVRDDVPVRGRVLDIEGRPVARAKIELVGIWAGKEGTLDAWEAAASQEARDFTTAWSNLRIIHEGYAGAHAYNWRSAGDSRVSRDLQGPQLTAGTSPGVVPAATTDANGSFDIKGLGQERLAEIVVSGPGIETTHRFLRSRAGQVVNLPLQRRSNVGSQTIYASEFTHVGAPSVPVTGRIVDSKTGQPLAGVAMHSRAALAAAAISDADGRYRLEGLPLGGSALWVRPPTGSRHVPGGVNVETSIATSPLVRDVKLTRGIVVRAKAVDERTGKSLRGQIEYFAYRTNPHVEESDSLQHGNFHNFFLPDVDGSFQVPVLPGQGILAYGAGSNFPTGIGADAIDCKRLGQGGNSIRFDTAPNWCFADSHNLLVPVNPQADDNELTINLSLRSAADITGRVVSPSGQPLTDYYIYGLRTRVTWQKNAGEKFTVSGYFPNEVRRLLVYHPEQNLAGHLELRGDSPEKLEIKLQPAVTLTGRVLDAEGQPIENAMIDGMPQTLSHRDVPQERDRGILYGHRNPEVDAQGRFEIKGVIPGLKYTAGIRGLKMEGGRKLLLPLGTIFTDVVARPGETKDLGDLRPVEEKRDQMQRAAAATPPLNPPANGGKDESAKGEDAVATREAELRTQGSPAGASQPEKSKIQNPFKFAGTVVDATGQPVAGAKIALQYHRNTAAPAGAPPAAVTDVAGKFQFTRTPANFSDSAAEAPWTEAGLLATKDGFGFAWGPAHYFDTTGQIADDQTEFQRQFRQYAPGARTNVLTLVADDVPIRGRVVNLEGKPVAGLLVEAVSVSEGLRAALAAAGARPPRPALLFSTNLKGAPLLPVPAVRTDADGTFTLQGLGRDRIANLLLRAPGVETAVVRVRTAPEEAAANGPQNQMREPARGEQLYAAQFTHVVGPSVPIEGRITDSRTRAPIVGARLRSGTERSNRLAADYIGATTDADGRYRLEGWPLGTGRVAVIPPADSRYVGGGFELKTSVNAPLTFDIGLFPGVRVHGRIIDERTGKPLDGVVEYFAFTNNPSLPEAPGFANSFLGGNATTGRDGRFSIPALPGKGLITFRAADADQFPRGAGADKVDGPSAETRGARFSFSTQPYLAIDLNFSLLTSIDPAPDAEELSLDLKLRSGVILTGRAVAPDGRALSDYFVYGQESFGAWKRNAGEEFAVNGYFADAGRRLMFYHPETNLVGLMDITGEAPENLKVTLRPGATLTGRVLDTAGTPFERGSISNAALPARRPDGTLSPDERERGLLLQGITVGDPPPAGGFSVGGSQFGADGRFELRGIIPGLKYSAQFMGPPTRDALRFSGRLFTDVIAEPGETKALGDLRPVQEKRDQMPQAGADNATNPTTSPASSIQNPKSAIENLSTPPLHPPANGGKNESPPAAGTVTLAGRVVDAQKQPVAGAKLYAPFGTTNTPRSLIHPDWRVVGTSDARGEFRVSVAERHPYFSAAHTEVAVVSPGMGVEWFDTQRSAGAPPRSPRERGEVRADAVPLEVVLVPEHVIKGRFIDTEGRPIAGATLRVESIYAPPLGGSLDGYFAALKKAPPQMVNRDVEIEMAKLRGSTGLPGPEIVARSDATGRFEIRGLAPEIFCWARVEGERIASTTFRIVNRLGFVPDPAATRTRNPNIEPSLFVGPDFTFVCEPGVAVAGRITDQAGRPVAGVTVQGNRPNHTSGDTLSDADGRYRITGLKRARSAGVQFRPDDSSALLPRAIAVDTQSGSDTVELDVELKEGIVITGRVIDGATGQGLYGVVDFHPLPENEFVKQGLLEGGYGNRPETRPDGTFRFTTIPGPLVIGVEPLGGRFRLGDRILSPFRQTTFSADERQRLGDLAVYFQAAKTATKFVDQPPGAAPLTIDFVVDRGKTVELEVNDAAGAAIENPIVSGIAEYGSSAAPASGPRTTVYALSADRPRKVLVAHFDRRLSGVLTLTGDEPSPVRVTLKPTASLRGRAMNDKGEPLSETELALRFDATVNDHAAQELYRYANRSIVTDASGRFEIPVVVPDEPFVLTATIQNRQLQDLPADERHRLTSGQNLDLGDVTFAPPGRRQQAAAPSGNPTAKDTTANPETIGSGRSVATETPPLNPPANGRKNESPPPAAAAPASPSPSTGRAGVGAGAIIVAGRVVDPDGKPVTGVELHMPVRAAAQSLDDQKLDQRGTSDADGRFSVTVGGADFSNGPMPATLIASRPGYGIEWIDVRRTGQAGPAEIVLRPELPISGRVIDSEGRPVAGAEISVNAVSAPKSGNSLDEFLAASKATGEQAFMQMRSLRTAFQSLLAATTDNEGRFALKGIAAERVCRVDIAAPDIVTTTLYIVNRAGFDAGNRSTADRPVRAVGSAVKLIGPDFTHVGVPAFRLSGRVTVEGRPVAGIPVDASQSHTQTDDLGRYQIGGLPRGQTVIARIGRGYTDGILVHNESISALRDEAVKTLDVDLKRGVVVTGRVVDRTTGKGVPAGISFLPLPENDFAKRTASRTDRIWKEVDANGQFGITVKPGPGVLLVQAHGERRDIGGQLLSPFRQADFTDDDARHVQQTVLAGHRFLTVADGTEHLAIANAVKYVNFAAGSTPEPVQLELDRGKTIEVEFVDADGRPVPGAFVAGVTEHWPITAQLADARATILALGANRPRKLLAVHAERGLAGSITLTGDEPSPVRLALNKAATIRGRAVDDAGMPIADARLSLVFDITPSDNSASELHRFLKQPAVQTDAAGRFEIPNLVPGEAFALRLTVDRKTLQDASANSSRRLTAGQTLDAGDIRFTPPDRQMADAPASPASIQNPAAAVGSEGGTTNAGSTTTSNVMLTGRVVDEQKRPIAGATLYAPFSEGDRDQSAFDVEYRSVGSTSADGRFTVSVAAAHPAYVVGTAQIAVRSPGKGVQWFPAQAATTERPIEIVLPPESVLRGRLITTEGQPVAGATVSVLDLSSPQPGGSLDPVMGLMKGTRTIGRELSTELGRLRNARGSAGPRIQSVTDTMGRFELHEVPAETLCRVLLVGDQIASSSFYVVNRPGFGSDADRAAAAASGQQTLLRGPGFTHVCEPGLTVYGQVTDENKRPLADVRVNGATYHSVLTDATGRYRVSGLARREDPGVAFRPGPKSGFLPRRVPIDTSSQAAAFEVNTTLSKGVIVRGRVTDRATGQGLASLIHRNLLPENAAGRTSAEEQAASPQRSRPDGSFEFTTVPGPMLIGAQVYGGLVQANGASFSPFLPVVFSESERQRLGQLMARDERSAFQAAKIIEALPGGDPVTVELQVQIGRRVDLELTDSNGRPVDGAWVSGLAELGTMTARAGNSRATAFALTGEHPRKILAVDFERHLAGSVTATGDETAPVRLMLTPAASLHGRLVDPAGVPVSETEMRIAMGSRGGSNAARELYRVASPFAKTDDAGQFILPVLPVDEPFSLIVADKNRRLHTVLVIESHSLKSGQDRDVGDVVYPPSNPPRRIEATDKNALKDEQRSGKPAPRATTSGSRAPDPATEPGTTTAQATAGERGPAGGRPAVPPEGGTTSGAASVTLSGHVVDAQRKPLAGARLYSTVYDPRLWESEQELRLVAVSDSQGTFAVKFPRRTSQSGSPPLLVIHHPGMGVEWLDVESLSLDRPLEVVLRPEQVIHGRFIDTEGRPIAGVKVAAEILTAPPTGGTLDPYFAAIKQSREIAASGSRSRSDPGLQMEQTKLRSISVLQPLAGGVTDSDGRVELHGIAPETICCFRASGENIATVWVRVVNRTGFDPRPYFERFSEGRAKTTLGPDFTQACEPGLVVEGRVSGGNAEGVPRVRIQAYTSGAEITGVTDTAGRYRLYGFARGARSSFQFQADPATGLLQKSLLQQSLPADGSVHKLDLELKPGVTVTGRVVDAETGEGVFSTINVAATADNEDVRRGAFPQYASGSVFYTSPDGEFRLVAIPGDIVVAATPFGAVRVGGRFVNPYRRTSFSEDDLRRLGSLEYIRTNTSAAAFVNGEPGAAPPAVELNVHRGKTVDVNLVDAAGAPVPGALVSGIAATANVAISLAEPRATVYALGDSSPRKVLVAHFDRRLAGSIRLTGDEPSSVKVVLVPTALLRGRAVDDKGAPLAEAEVALNFAGADADSAAQQLYRFPNRTSVMTDENGRFEFPAIVPGEPFTLGATLDRRQLKPVDKQYVLESGQSLDLGDVAFALAGRRQQTTDTSANGNTISDKSIDSYRLVD